MSILKKFAAIILCLTMLLSLAACGKESERTDMPGTPDMPNTHSDTEHPKFVYTAQFKPLSMSSDRGIRFFSAGDAGAYVSWQEGVGGDEYEARLGLLDFDGSIHELENYKSVPMLENTGGYREFYSYLNLSCVHPMADGKLLVLESRNASWNEAPEGMDENNEEYWGYYNYQRDQYIRVLNADGSELSTNQIGIDGDTYLNTYSCTVDAQGNFLCSNDTGLVAIAADGSIAYEITGGGNMYIDMIFTLADGTVAFITWGEKGLQLVPVDMESKSFDEAVALPNDAYNIYSGGGDYDLYYISGINLYGFNIATGESVKLLNWMDCDITSNGLIGLCFNSDGRILTLISNWSYSRYSGSDENSVEAAVVSKVPYESVPQKTVLTLASQYINGSSLSSYIAKFNRSSNKYRISVKDYSEYNTGDDRSIALTKLNTEIMAGNIPDIILMSSSIPYEQYAAKGILEDLYPYIDADSEINREDFFPTLLSALEVDGRLCQAAGSFSVQTVVGAKSIVGDTPGWTFEQYYEALEKMPEGVTGFDSYTDRDSILRALLAVDSDYYADWTTGECRFDSPEFVQMLKFAAGFPAMDDEYAYAEGYTDFLSEGKQMLTSSGVYSFEDCLYSGIYFGPDNTTYIGYPTHEGTGNLFVVNEGLAIGKNCADKDGAWQFVRGLLTEKGQEETVARGLPSNKNVFERYLEQEMTPIYQKDSGGNFVLDESGEKIPLSRATYGLPDGTFYESFAITQEQADQMYELINSTTKLANYNDSIFKIVNEQAQAYFAGQKSAEEVAKLVQSKANIYVNEQR